MKSLVMAAVKASEMKTMDSFIQVKSRTAKLARSNVLSSTIVVSLSMAGRTALSGVSSGTSLSNARNSMLIVKTAPLAMGKVWQVGKLRHQQRDKGPTNTRSLVMVAVKVSEMKTTESSMLAKSQAVKLASSDVLLSTTVASLSTAGRTALSGVSFGTSPSSVRSLMQVADAVSLATEMVFQVGSLRRRRRQTDLFNMKSLVMVAVKVSEMKKMGSFTQAKRKTVKLASSNVLLLTVVASLSMAGRTALSSVSFGTRPSRNVRSLMQIAKRAPLAMEKAWQVGSLQQMQQELELTNTKSLVTVAVKASEMKAMENFMGVKSQIGKLASSSVLNSTVAASLSMVGRTVRSGVLFGTSPRNARSLMQIVN